MTASEEEGFTDEVCAGTVFCEELGTRERLEGKVRDRSDGRSREASSGRMDLNSRSASKATELHTSQQGSVHSICRILPFSESLALWLQETGMTS